MTREKAIEILKDELYSGSTGCDAEISQALGMAIKAMEQEPILDKITAEIQKLRGCSCWDSDGIIDDVEDIIDKYKAESEGE